MRTVKELQEILEQHPDDMALSYEVVTSDLRVDDQETYPVEPEWFGPRGDRFYLVLRDKRTHR